MSTSTNEFESHSNFPNNPIHILQPIVDVSFDISSLEEFARVCRQIYGLEGLSSMTRELISNSSQNKCVALFILFNRAMKKKL